MQNKAINYIPRLAESVITADLQSGTVVIVMGARQVGKTTLMQEVLKAKKVCTLNFDVATDKQRFMAASALEPVQALRVFENPDYLVIDEIQRVPEATRIIKGWYDSKLPVTFVLLGSSSIQIADHAAESLAGRNRKRILPSLTLYEIIRNQSWAHGLPVGEIQAQFQDAVDSLLLQSLAFGNYPEAVLTSDKRAYLMNLTSDILMRDLLQLGLVRNSDSLQKILMLLAHQIGAEVSINELSRTTGIARPTVERYLALLEQSFIVFKLPAFSTNPRKEIAKSQKYFFWDTGIRNAILNEFSENPLRSDIGGLWENWVVAEIARQNLLSGQQKKLYFWRSVNGSEVDLVLQKDETLQAFEIKWNPKRKSGRAFTHAYKTPVEIIHRNTPLVLIDEFLGLIEDN